jgi:hypothetical protein
MLAGKTRQKKARYAICAARAIITGAVPTATSLMWVCGGQPGAGNGFCSVPRSLADLNLLRFRLRGLGLGLGGFRRLLLRGSLVLHHVMMMDRVMRLLGSLLRRGSGARRSSGRGLGSEGGKSKGAGKQGGSQNRERALHKLMVSLNLAVPNWAALWQM